MRRALVWVVLLICAALVLMGAITLDRHPGLKGVPAVSPDPRRSWMPVDVGGFILCRPDTAICGFIPEGSILWIPKETLDSAKAD